MNQFDPNLESQGTEQFDRLLAGDKQLVTGTVVLASGQNLSRGAILGRADGGDGDWYHTDDGTAADGREVGEAVLAEDTDTTDGQTNEVPVYFEGTFNRAELTVAAGSIDEDELRDHGIHVKDTVTR